MQTFASQVRSLGIEMGPLYWERRVLASEPKGKSMLWAFLRHVLTFSEAGFFISLSLHPETFSLVQAYSSQKRFSVESSVSGSRMKFNTPFNFKPYHSFWEVTTWNMQLFCREEIINTLNWKIDQFWFSDLSFYLEFLCLWLIHFAVQQKRTQHCKATILQ